MAEKEMTQIVDRVTKDGSSGYKAEKGRYHLYISNVCPFAHRAMIGRALKGLVDVITVDNLSPKSDPEHGWEFAPEKEGCTADTVNGKKFLKEVYHMSHPEYKGRITVPVLFDKKTKKIVNNESADILRMLNTEFNEFSATEAQAKLDYYPEEKRKEIEEINEWMGPTFVYGVYKVGRAETQEVYNEACDKLFNTLDKLDKILSTKRYLTGSQLTEADIKFFVVLVRFDPVYHSLLKCNKKMICQYEHIWPYVRDIYQTSSIRATVNIDEIKEGYWTSKRYCTPNYLVPAGPELNFLEKTSKILMSFGCNIAAVSDGNKTEFNLI